MTNKENAERIIRYLQDTVTELQLMGNGYKFKHNGHLWTVCGVSGDEGEFSDFIAVLQPFKDRLPSTRLWSKVELEQLSNIEIIGHEPELRHLLLAIQAVKPDSYAVMTDGMIYSISGKDCDYEDVIIDLTKSLLANLEDNEELTTYLINLFNLN